MTALYNGVKLPNIEIVYTNDLKSQYPNVILLQHTTGYYYLTCTADKKTADTDGWITSNNGPEWYLENETWVETGIAAGTAIWANYDVYTTNGTLYLAASSPIPVGTPITDPVSFMMGYQIGCRLRAQRGAKKPIGYSYNGVVLPELPKVEGYPYQTIINLDGEYVLVLTEDKFLTYTPGNVASYRHQWTVIWENGGSGIQITTDCLIGRVNGSEWDISEGSMLGPNCQSVVWTNYDIYERVNNAITDTVHLATTDPVPVYE